MPKVTGPLFSIAASGSVARLLTFKMTAHGPVCTKTPQDLNSRSTGQAKERDRMQAAALAWQGLDDDTRTIWQSNTVPTIKSAWMCFFHEYVAQQVRPPNLPRIPATFLGQLPPAEPDIPIIVNDLGPLLVHQARRVRCLDIVIIHHAPTYSAHSIRDPLRARAIVPNNRGTVLTHGAAHRQQPFNLPAPGKGAIIAHGMRAWPQHGTARTLNRGTLTTHGAGQRIIKI